MIKALIDRSPMLLSTLTRSHTSPPDSLTPRTKPNSSRLTYSMYIKSAALCLTGAALFGGAAAWPSGNGYVTVPGRGRNGHQHPGKRQVQEIQGALGCDAKGPLTGAWAVEIFTCQADNK